MADIQNALALAMLEN